MIDGGIEIDLEEVVQNIAEAEVVCLFFPTLRRTLLIDTRTNDYAGSMIKVVPMAKNGGDRLRSLRKLRPQFGRPESITLIPWDARIATLVTLGVWDTIVRRIDSVDAAAECFEALCAIEHEEHRAAITGERYHTIWSRTSPMGD